MSQHPSWNSLHRIAAAAAIVICAPALAQNTTSSLGGRVTDDAGKPIGGARVTIVHVESGSVANATTDAEGRYSARGLRVGGPYTVTFAVRGFSEKQEGVYLQLAEAQALDMVLPVPVTRVTVTGQGVSDKINSSVMGTGTNISSRDLTALASIQRNLQDYARTDPRLSQTDKERGEISAMGQNSRFNRITVDGVNISDSFGLEANNLPTAKQPISIDAIQSVQVNVANYDVTQKGYTGANINAVTKSGTNEFHGALYYVYRDNNGVGQRFSRTAGTYSDFTPFKEDTKGLNLGGPIIKDKLFFFASYEESKSNRAQPDFGPAGSNLTNVGISQTAIANLTNVAKTQYNIDIGTIGGSSLQNVKDSLLRVDWNINEQHRANLRLARTEQSETNNGSFSGYNITGLQLTSNWFTQQKKIDTVVGQWFADWTSDFSTELKLSNRDYHSVPIPFSQLPAMALRITGPAPAESIGTVNTGTRFLNFGTERSRHFNILDTKTIDGYLGGTWTRGAHEFKFGGDVQSNKVFNAFFQDTFGNYTFACLNSSASLTYSFGAINCATATSAQNEAAAIENFAKGRPSAYQVQVPVPGGSLDNGIAKWTLTDTGVFLQDTWAVNKALNIVGGVRVDTLSTSDKPLFNAAAAAPTVAGSVSGTTVVRNGGGFGLDNSQTVDGKNLLQPRIGFNYSIISESKLKSQVRGGVGLFQGEAANVWLSNPYSNTGVTTRIIGCGIAGFNACTSASGQLNVDPKNPPTTFSGNPPAANVDFIASGLSQPSVWKGNLAYDTELPGGMVAGVEWLRPKVRTGIYYQHLNLGAPTRIGPDGRELYFTPQSYSPACWTSTGTLLVTGACAGGRSRALSNPLFNNVLLAKDSGKGGGDAVTFSLGNPARGSGVNWQVAYTRTDATEVSPLTSSVSNSNFNARSIFNPNENVDANSAYLVRDRFSASATWSKAFISDYKSTVGLFFEARRGKTYSWTYANDVNGDGVSGNDLMYIPKAPQSGEVVFGGDTAASHPNEDRFWAIVANFPDLDSARGRVVPRNGSFAPWVNQFDMRFSQELPGFFPKQKGVLTFDILNVGNLLNKSWGRINEIAFASAGGQRRTFVNVGGLDASGRYVYYVQPAADDLTLRQVKGESQWALQMTLKYEF